MFCYMQRYGSCLFGPLLRGQHHDGFTGENSCCRNFQQWTENRKPWICSVCYICHVSWQLTTPLGVSLHLCHCLFYFFHAFQRVPDFPIRPLTIVWDDGPGHGRGVNSSNHPEHAQPAQMLSSFLSSQHLRKVREHDWNRSTNPANIVRYNWLRTSNLVLSVCAVRSIWQIPAKQIWRDRKSFGKKPSGLHTRTLTHVCHHPNKLALAGPLFVQLSW